MKKIISSLCVILASSLLFGYDIASEAELKGGPKNITKTDFSIVSKFGEYFRTPSTKYTYIFDTNGKTVESSELTARDTLVNKITNVYDTNGNLTQQICTDSDGIQLWKSESTYKNGKKADVSEYGKDGSLKSKTIYTYENSKLADETVYNSEGALVEKTTYKYDDKGRVNIQDIYFNDGSLAQESQITYTDNGKKDSVSYFDKNETLTSKCIFRYATNGTLSEVTTYGQDTQVTMRQLVKYDGNGNISRITTYNVARKFGTTVNEMVDMLEFSYNYNSTGSSAAATAKQNNSSVNSIIDAK